MVTGEELGQLRDLIALQTAQELTTQGTVTAHAEVRSGKSFVDAKLLTKSNMYSGEHDVKERWSTWSFKMRADVISKSAGSGDQARRDDSE